MQIRGAVSKTVRLDSLRHFVTLRNTEVFEYNLSREQQLELLSL